MSRIVQLTTYPLKAPRHGGQLRCAAIRERYRALGLQVETIAAIHGTDYRSADHERNDMVLSADHAGFDPKLPRFIDLQSGHVIVSEPALWRTFSQALDRLAPDAIQLEQPWLFPAVKRWFDEREAAGERVPHLIYSSQNIEWKLKRDEARDSADAVATRHVLGLVEALEREVVRAADLVVACTDEELAELRSMDDAARSRGWIVAHNAIAPFNAEPQRIDAVRKRYGLQNYSVFVGSAHPPNAAGFWQMLAPSLAFLRPDEKIVVIGGVSHYLRQHRIYAEWPAINEPRLAVLGEVERDDLVALICGAAVILLPITAGGGSNLKTAEAIYSGNPVLATPHALRGYGDASRWPTLKVADTADAFRRTLRAMLDDNAPTPPADYARVRAEVTWERSLAPLADAIGDLLQKNARA